MKHLIENLTDKDIERQDFVDSKIALLLGELCQYKNETWSNYDIGEIRDVIQSLFVRDYNLMTEREFYPFFEE